MTKYTVTRMFFENSNNYTVKTGITLEEAQEHCNDPETSSKTCSDDTEPSSPWFDGYTEE